MPVDPATPNPNNNAAYRPQIPYPRWVELLPNADREAVRQEEDNWGEVDRYVTFNQQRGFPGSGGMYKGLAGGGGILNPLVPGNSFAQVIFTGAGPSQFQYADTTQPMPDRTRVVLANVVIELTVVTIGGGKVDATIADNGPQPTTLNPINSLMAFGDKMSFQMMVPCLLTLGTATTVQINLNVASTVNVSASIQSSYIY